MQKRFIFQMEGSSPHCYWEADAERMAKDIGEPGRFLKYPGFPESFQQM